MSIYGHFNAQYDGNKVAFPKESFLIRGISYYQDKLINIGYESELNLYPEPSNKYDKTAIQILFNNNKIGYVPNEDFFKNMCIENINNNLKIINIKPEHDNGNLGIRVILDKYYTEDLKNIGIF